MIADFQKGDRIRLSPLGKKNSPNMRSHMGTVVYEPRGRTISVILDGQRGIVRLHKSYLEIEKRWQPRSED